MLPQTQPPPQNSSRVNLLISFVFHAAIVLALFFFAAREGLLGHQLKKIAVDLVKEKEPDKPKEPEKPKEEPPRVEPAKVVETPRLEPPRETAATPPPNTAVAPPSVAPPPAEVPAFAFDGGKAVQSSSDPVELYRGYVEYSLRANWHRPDDLDDDTFAAVVELSVDSQGHISNPQWLQGSGNTRWDNTVRLALAATPALDRPPPAHFPSRIHVRFDVQQTTEPVIQ